MDERVHLKGLNGLRAIAALGVVVTHATSPDFNLNGVLPVGLADYSVTIFFTLSGFLITYLLFIEKERTGISVKNFYMRRILRIWPLYFAYLLIALAIIYYETPTKLPGSLPYYLFFAANIPTLLHTHLRFLSHYWSLGVEEQFYLFWPWLMKKSKTVLRSIVVFTLVFFILKLIARFIFFEQGNPVPLEFLFTTRFECMSIGGIAAILCIQKNALFFRISSNRFTEISCWACIVVISANRFFISHFINHDIVALVTVCLIVNLAFNKKPLVSLEHKCFDFLGRISYGIYIIHPLVIYSIRPVLNIPGWGQSWKYIIYYTAVFACTVFAAWLSYEFFEKRFLRLKDRFSFVKTSA